MPGKLDRLGRRIHRPVRRRPNDGVAPRDDRIRLLILAMKEANKNLTPAEIKAFLAHENGVDVPVDEIIGAINGL